MEDKPYAHKLRDCALWFANQGHPVFPLRPGLKTPASRAGHKDATTEPHQIHAWWDGTREYNIGLPTGHHFDVLDIDLPPDAWGIVEHPDLPQDNPLAMARTPRGGCHLYLPPNPGHRNAVGILPGIDYRASGGYVVAPPSRTATGQWTYIDHGGLAK